MERRQDQSWISGRRPRHPPRPQPRISGGHKAEFTKRFEREARAVAGPNHLTIFQLHDVGQNYLVMEFVDGGPIAATADATTLLDQAMQMADGMAAAQALRI